MAAQSGSDGASASIPPSNSGLGRGLSGILGDVAEHGHGEEVSALLGSSQRRNSPEVRRIVAELAVDTMSAAFAADGVLMARLGADGSVDPLHTRLAGTWSQGDPVGFEVNGRLWNCLTERTSVQGQVPVGRLHVLFARHKIDGVVIATAVVRSRSFSRAEQDQLAGLIRSAARATEVESPLSDDAELRVDVTALAGEAAEATVALTIEGQRRRATAGGRSVDDATARAVIEALDLPFDVRFAGSTVVEGDTVTIVVLNRDEGAVFGLGVTDSNSNNGAVEATISAAVSGGFEPLVSSLSA